MLSKHQDEFLAMAGHELRTPLTAIRGFLELLEKHPEDFAGKKSATYLAGMRLAVDQLTQLVRDLMDTSKIRTGKLVLTKTSFDLDKLVAEEIKSLGPAAINRIRKKTRVRPAVFADRSRLAQVLMNLLTNALKYSAPESKVWVALSREDGFVVVSIQDFGIGIEKKDQVRIFDPFYQGEHPLQPGRGLGLGLFISSQIMVMHQGKILVESRVGKGSTFKVFLPVSKGNK